MEETRFRWPRLARLVIWASLVSTSIQQRNPITDFCRRFGHQTAVVGRRLYIDGGLVNWNSMNADPANYTNSWLIWHDLDNVHNGMPQIHADLNKNASIPSVHGGALWADDVNYRLFLFGGEFYNGNPTTLSLLSYDIWNDKWDNFGAPAGIQRVSYGASVNVAERGEGYYFGGYLSNASTPGWAGSPLATTGLIRYRMDGNSWTNITGPDNIGRAEGVATFLPVSDGGMLVYFGGVQDPYRNGSRLPQPMEQIFVYDFISNKWHVQTATGQIPEYRRRFCAGAAWAKDRSSYNIYLNAGLGFDGLGYDDVYVLSIPSFTWIKTYPLDRNGTGEYPSHSLSCNVVNDGSQMLAIGGSFPKDNTCDYEQVWGVHNLDLGNQIKDNFQKVWAEYSPTLKGYKVPEFITNAIGGNSEGAATKMAPDAGFVNRDLGILLSMNARFPSRARANDGRTDPAAAINTASSTPTPVLSLGAIIGIAVGGGVALIALIIGVYCLVRRKRRQRQAQAMPSSEMSMHPPMSPSYAYSYHPPSESGHGGSPMRPEMYSQSYIIAELDVRNK